MKNNKKSGVSLIILITMIVIALILLTLSVIAVGSTVQNSSISAFGNDLKEVEDACGAHYIENGLSSFDVIEKNDILKLVGDKNNEEFKNDIHVLTYMQDLSHGAMRYEVIQNDGMIIKVCEALINFVKKKYPKQIENCVNNLGN